MWDKILLYTLPAIVGMGMTDTGRGTGADTKIDILIRTRSTLTRIPARYIHTHDHH